MEKVVYITGGTKGIGYGVAKKLIEAGYRVAISGRNIEDVKKAAKSIGNEEKMNEDNNAGSFPMYSSYARYSINGTNENKRG